MYQKKPVKQSSGAKRQWLIAGTILLLVIGSGWWAYGYFRGDDMAAINALRDKLRDDNLTDDQRRALFGQMREEWEKLSPEQQHQARQSREERFNRDMEKRLTAFFQLSPAEREKELDKEIDEMEKRRKEWEKRRQERGRDGNRNQNRLDGGGGRGGWGGGQRGPSTGEQRLQRQKDRLSATTPELRAMRSDYFRMLQDRRQARGLPPFGGGRGGRGGRGPWG